MLNLGRIVFVTALLAGCFALVKYFAYGISEEFGWGFVTGGVLMTLVGLLGMFLAEKETEERVRAELSRPGRPLDL